MYAQAKRGNPSGRGQVISKVASDLYCSFIFCPCQCIKAVLHGLPGEKGDISLEVEWLAPLGMHTWQSFASFKNMRMTERVLKPGGMSVSKCREV